MGIPSYYKKLIDSVPGLITKGHPSETIEWLFMDFNCLIYHCLQRENTPPYPGDTMKDEWEAQFLDCVAEYTIKVIKEVGPKKGVYIAIDGVVPMAKMRQQRLRRFKSVWLSQNESDGALSGSKWDRNAITPGTLFMSKLRKRLETMIAKQGKSTWKLSSSDEPGEGEHKIISEWRSMIYSGDFAVYGLDADLIVLSILGRETCNLQNKIWLFREEINAGKIQYDAGGEEVFEWFSINHLTDWLSRDFTTQRQFNLNYCFAMSVLGNDFLPSSLGLKIRDDGHSELLDIIRGLTTKGHNLINSSSLEISYDGLMKLFDILAADEEKHIYKYIQKKQRMAKGLGLSDQNYGSSEHIKVGDNNWPLAHIEESVLVEDRQMCTEWHYKYITHFFPGFEYTKNNIAWICNEYLYGIQWIWAYYTGEVDSVCFNWFYPFNLPPLWRDLKTMGGLPEFPKNVYLKAGDIRPIEQLALVLPLESWSLIPNGPEKMLPELAPQFFPSSFGFESVGKRYFWECESMIPLPSILEIKKIICGCVGLS
jgi:5'-3' exonuclease